MEARLPRHTLLIGLLVSLLLHATVLLPALVAIMRSESAGPGRLQARFEPDDFRQPETEPPDDVEPLGIDESRESTLTWIGYDEYQEHLAALAETEQAAFASSPAGGPQAETPVEAAPTVEPQPPDEPEQTTDALAELEAWLEATAPGPGPPPGEPTDPTARPDALDEILASLDRLLNEPPAPAEPQQPVQPAEEVPQTAAAPKQDPGEVADQESDPTSTVDVPVENIKLGKPLAAHGLRIKPRKPVFTTLTMLTAAPANPRAELRFRRDGKPQRVRILESSGDSRIDEAILNSLYRWRASGKRLKELKRGETVPVRIRIVLIPTR
jgi:hypothetical protein